MFLAVHAALFQVLPGLGAFIQQLLLVWQGHQQVLTNLQHLLHSMFPDVARHGLPPQKQQPNLGVAEVQQGQPAQQGLEQQQQRQQQQQQEPGQGQEQEQEQGVLQEQSGMLHKQQRQLEHQMQSELRALEQAELQQRQQQRKQRRQQRQQQLLQLFDDKELLRQISMQDLPPQQQHSLVQGLLQQLRTQQQLQRELPAIFTQSSSDLHQHLMHQLQVLHHMFHGQQQLLAVLYEHQQQQLRQLGKSRLLVTQPRTVSRMLELQQQQLQQQRDELGGAPLPQGQQQQQQGQGQRQEQWQQRLPLPLQELQMGPGGVLVRHDGSELLSLSGMAKLEEFSLMRSMPLLQVRPLAAPRLAQVSVWAPCTQGGCYTRAPAASSLCEIVRVCVCLCMLLPSCEQALVVP